MGWEKGRYYTRSRKVNGRVVREYIGGGRIGYLASELDCIERQERQVERETTKAEREQDRKQENYLRDYCNAVDELLRETLEAAGYHKHRGQWRLKHGKEENCNGFG